MGEVVPASTSPTLRLPSPPTVHQLSQLALLRVNISKGEDQHHTFLYLQEVLVWLKMSNFLIQQTTQKPQDHKRQHADTK